MSVPQSALKTLRTVRNAGAVFAALVFLVEASARLRNALGVWKLAALLLVLAFSVRSYLKERHQRSATDELLPYLGGIAAIILVMTAWGQMGGGWLFVLGVFVVLYAAELLTGAPSQRTATRREAAEWALAQWRHELQNVGPDSPRGAECRKHIATLEAQLANWPAEWDREDAALNH